MSDKQSDNKETNKAPGFFQTKQIYCIVYDMQNAKRMRCFSSMYAVAFVYVVEGRKCRCEDAMQRKINPNAATEEAEL